MRTSSALALLSAGLIALFGASLADAQDVATASPTAATAPALAAANAVDAAQALASQLDVAGGSVTAAAQLSALQDAAGAGDPVALWQLGLMYENGDGVTQDRARAFAYFEQIADQYADSAPRGAADIVAHSFVKLGEYYKDGNPEAGVPKNVDRSNRMIQQAAQIFGDADAQYRLGVLYLDKDGLGINPVQSKYWFYSAATKGNVPAQARLGDLLFNGNGDVKASPVEGLMWLTVASRRAVETVDADWIDDLLNAAMSVASPDERKQAIDQADVLQTTLPVL